MDAKSILEIGNKFTVKKITVPSILIVIVLIFSAIYFQFFIWLKTSKEHSKFISQHIKIFLDINEKQLKKIETYLDYNLYSYTLNELSLPFFARNIFVLNKEKELVLSYPKNHKLPRLEHIFDRIKQDINYSVPYYSINLKQLSISLLDTSPANFSYLVELDLAILDNTLKKLVDFSVDDSILVTDRFGNVFASNQEEFIRTQENINHFNFFSQLKTKNSFIGIEKILGSYYVIFAKKENNFVIAQLTKIKKIIIPAIGFIIFVIIVLSILNTYLIFSINTFVKKNIASRLKELSNILSRPEDEQIIISNLSIIKNKNYFQELNVVINKLIYYLKEIDKKNKFLSQKNTELSFLINNLPLWLWYLKSPTTFGLVNKNMAHFFGYEPEDLSYQDIESKLLTSKEVVQENIEENKKIFAQGIIGQKQSWYENKTGEKRLIAITKIPIFKENTNKVESVICVGMDQTEVFLESQKRKELEKRLLKVQKLETIGTLASGIAHHFNNLLQSILFYIQKVKNKEENKEIIQKIETQVKKGKGFVQSLLNISHKTPEEMEVFEFKNFIGNIVEVIKNSYPKNIKIEAILPPSEIKIKGNPGLLEQAILNITNNAKDALKNEPAGKITLKVESVQEETGQNWLEITISDNGPGIAPEIRDKLFEPFFTTKGIGEGTGLGLYLVYQIVKMHKGEISLEETTKGTAFKVLLPITEEREEKGSEQQKQVSSLPQLNTILLVDDEEMIVEGLEEFLTSAFKVNILKALNGQEALEVFQKYSQEISLVILDLGLPGISGEEVLKKIKTLHPKTRVIVCSGYHHHPIAKNPKQFGAELFLSKLYDFEQLIESIKGIFYAD